MNPTLAQKDFGPRLLTLRNGQVGLRSALTTEAMPQGEESIITFTASDATLDRYNEIIDPAGWQLGNYLKNPVFQADHDYCIEDTIGKAIRVWVEGGKLRQTIQFATGINPLADMAYKLYRGGFLNAVSVGFIPIRWENGGDAVGYRRKYVEVELVELSAVAVPANPNALQDAIEQGTISGDEIDRLKNFRQQRVPPANAPAPGGADSAGLLTQLQATLAMMRGKS